MLCQSLRWRFFRQSFLLWPPIHIYLPFSPFSPSLLKHRLVCDVAMFRCCPFSRLLFPDILSLPCRPHRSQQRKKGGGENIRPAVGDATNRRHPLATPLTSSARYINLNQFFFPRLLQFSLYQLAAPSLIALSWVAASPSRPLIGYCTEGRGTQTPSSSKAVAGIRRHVRHPLLCGIEGAQDRLISGVGKQRHKE